MKEELENLLASYPKKIDWIDVIDMEGFDDRLPAIDCLVTNTIGVSQGYLEFIPDNNPPLIEEVLCWIWAIRPDLTKELLMLNYLNNDFRLLLTAYSNNNMDEFWDNY